MSAMMQEPRPAYRVEQEKGQFMGRPVFAVRTRGGIPLAKFYGEPLQREATALARRLNERAGQAMQPAPAELVPPPPAEQQDAPGHQQHQRKASVRAVWAAVCKSMRKACGYNSLQAQTMAQAADDTARMAEALAHARDALRGVATPQAKNSRTEIDAALSAYWGQL